LDTEAVDGAAVSVVTVRSFISMFSNMSLSPTADVAEGCVWGDFGWKERELAFGKASTAAFVVVDMVQESD
jgi:hypothetical protein